MTSGVTEVWPETRAQGGGVTNWSTRSTNRLSDHSLAPSVRCTRRCTLRPGRSAKPLRPFRGRVSGEIPQGGGVGGPTPRTAHSIVYSPPRQWKELGTATLIESTVATVRVRERGSRRLIPSSGFDENASLSANGKWIISTSEGRQNRLGLSNAPTTMG